MSIKLILSPNYKDDRLKIKKSLINYAFENDENPKKYLGYFNDDEGLLRLKIKKSPLSSGELYSSVIRKGITSSGKYAIFYTWVPFDAKSNDKVHTVNLDQIYATESLDYSEIVSGFVQAEFKED